MIVRCECQSTRQVCGELASVRGYLDDTFVSTWELELSACERIATHSL